jgi:hypothetical protein
MIVSNFPSVKMESRRLSFIVIDLFNWLEEDDKSEEKDNDEEHEE